MEVPPGLEEGYEDHYKAWDNLSRNWHVIGQARDLVSIKMIPGYVVNILDFSA